MILDGLIVFFAPFMIPALWFTVFSLVKLSSGMIISSLEVFT